MKIAITGGAGFIGSRLKESLEKDTHETIIIDKANPENPIDVRDAPALAKACKDCDVIYHLAAEHADNVSPKSLYYDVNVGGAKNVVTAAEHNGIDTIIFTSTVAIYGLDAPNSDENTPPNPFNDYGKSKLESEQIFKEWADKDKGRKLTIIRPVVVFGEGNRGNVYNLLKQIHSGRFIMIGQGGNKKSMAYVENVVAFLKHCLNSKSGTHIYNYADKPDLTTKELLEIACNEMGIKIPGISLPYPLGLSAGYLFDCVSKITGKPLPVSSVRIKKFCADTTCKADKAHNSGFTPKFTLEEGLKRMIAYEFPKNKGKGEESKAA